MKRINSIYVSAALLVGVLLILNFSMRSKTASFYGFAENKETEINHISDILVVKIHVENGQEVKKGDLLIEVKDAIIPSKIDGLKLEKDDHNTLTKLCLDYNSSYQTLNSIYTCIY